jgi:hypothetical protein
MYSNDDYMYVVCTPKLHPESDRALPPPLPTKTPSQNLSKRKKEKKKVPVWLWQ